MKRSFLTLVVALSLVDSAGAQWQVPNDTVPVGRGTGFTGFKTTGTTIDSSGNLNNVGTITTRRTTAANVGGTLNIGAGTHKWAIIGNQLSGGDLIVRNPAGGNVLVFPETGGCVGIQANLTNCNASFMLDIGPGAGNAWARVNGATFTNNQGPRFSFHAGGSLVGEIGADCVFYGATACNNDLYINGPTSSRHFGFYNWGGVFVRNTPTPSPQAFVGGALTVDTDSTNAFVGGNAITATSRINTGGNFPTAITALMAVFNTTTGGPGATAWGIYSHCDLHATNGMAECASVEGTASNRYAAPNPPAAAGVPGMPQPFQAAIKATCGGTISAIPNLPGLFNCSVGFWGKYYSGAGGLQFLYGMYLDEGYTTSTGTGILVNATAALSPGTAAEFRHAGGAANRGLVVKNVGASNTNRSIDVQNSAGTSVLNVQNDGLLNALNGVSTTAVTASSSVVTPIVAGGSAANSSLFLRSTQGAGTSDVIIIQTGSQVEAGRILTNQNSAWGTTVASDPTNAFRMTVKNSTNNVFLAASTVANGATSGAQILSRNENTPSAADQRLGIFSFGAVTTGTTAVNSAGVSAFSSQAWGAGAAGTYLSFETTADSTTTRAEKMRLTSAGALALGLTVSTPPSPGPVIQVNMNTAAPKAPDTGTLLHMTAADTVVNRIILDTFGTGASAAITYRHARGTLAGATATQSGDVIGSNFAKGYQTTTNDYIVNAGSGFVMVATENYTSTNAGARVDIYATQNTTASTGAVARFDRPAIAGQTALQIFDVDNATIERVTVGAADSGGAGFKLLRIPN